MDAAGAAAPDRPSDEELLSSAIGVPASGLRMISREPLGAGAVTGFEVAHGAESGLPDGAPGAPRTTIEYVDTSGIPVARETGLVLEGVARVWTHPADPHLPALVPTAFGGAVVVLLERLGIEAVGAPEFVAYRPGRRAVLRVRTAEGTAWVKVVRPRRISRIVDAHRALEAGGLPTPRVRGWSPDGVLVIDAAAGTAAPDVAWEPDALLDRVDELRRRIERTTTEWTARTGVPERLPWYAERAHEAIPQHQAEVSRVRAACALGLATEPAERRTIHGDLHIGQLFLGGTGPDVAITGLIDVDTAGLGDPAEDAAAFCSHAAASALITADAEPRGRVWRLAEGAQRRWDGQRMRALTGIHLLGHALAAGMSGDDDRTRTLLALAEAAAVGAPLRGAAEPVGSAGASS
ncbi:phosphotransferase [Microbacterium halophytorum]|uniref:phosphotransferase n=1 Tax=Microbacterium halophytorum TaxID=2067568 RepID=UPI00131A281B|nr:phosphotransferase [Microbacterium halophytorum]